MCLVRCAGTLFVHLKCTVCLICRAGALFIELKSTIWLSRSDGTPFNFKIAVVISALEDKEIHEGEGDTSRELH